MPGAVQVPASTFPRSNKTLNAKTTLYSTDLDCLAHQSGQCQRGVTFSDGKGCVAEDVISYPDTEFSKRFQAHYIGYYDDPHITPLCSQLDALPILLICFSPYRR
jgi:hypothetical protein